LDELGKSMPYPILRMSFITPVTQGRMNNTDRILVYLNDFNLPIFLTRNFTLKEEIKI